jgi:hypothetical protein
MAKRKVKRRVVRAWTKADISMLRSMAKAKMSGPAIAEKLGRTRGAVSQKAMLLGVRFRSIRRKT